MRVIFEEVEGELFFEVILQDLDLENLILFGGLIGSYIWEDEKVKDLNLYLRKEQGCHLSKERKPEAKKVSRKTSKKRWKPGSRRSKL